MFEEVTNHQEIDGYTYHIHGYGCPFLGYAGPDEEGEKDYLQTPVDEVAKCKTAGILRTCLDTEGEAGSHDVVAAELTM